MLQLKLQLLLHCSINSALKAAKAEKFEYLSMLIHRNERQSNAHIISPVCYSIPRTEREAPLIKDNACLWLSPETCKIQ